MNFFFSSNDFSLLESCHLYITAKYKASNCCKIEGVIQRFSIKKVFLKILKNSQENLCARVSLLIKLQLKKRSWHRCFSVNIAKTLRTFFCWTPPVAPCVKIRTKSDSEISKISIPTKFWLRLIPWPLSTLLQNGYKTRYPQKNICGGGAHSYCNLNFKTFKLK